VFLLSNAFNVATKYICRMNNLRLLAYALALDQHRSFGRAAEAMHVTQPSFSRGIAALERDLGARLFDRSNRRVEPTPAGRVLLAKAQALIADAAALRGALDDHRQLRAGRLTVGAGPYPLDYGVIEAVARLARAHPGLQIELVEGQWRDFAPRLLSGEVEVAVMETSIVEADARFQVQRLPARPGGFFCRAGHSLAGRRGLTLAEVLAWPLVGVRIPGRLIGMLAPDLLGCTLDPLTGDLLPHITTTSVAASRAIVARTDGIGLAAPAQLVDALRAGTLVVLDAPAPGLQSHYGLTWLRGRSLSPGALAFIAALRAVEDELGGRQG